MGRVEVKEEAPATTDEPKEPTFFESFDQFIKEESINNMWVSSTKRALNVIKGHIEAWNPETSFDMLTESVLSQYINYHRTDLEGGYCGEAVALFQMVPGLGHPEGIQYQHGLPTLQTEVQGPQDRKESQTHNLRRHRV